MLKHSLCQVKDSKFVSCHSVEMILEILSEKMYSAIIKTKSIKTYKLNPKITNCYAMFLKNKKLLNNNKFKNFLYYPKFTILSYKNCNYNKIKRRK